MLGWNRRGPKIVELLDSFAEPGSRLVVASRARGPDPPQRSTLLNITIGFVECDLNDRAALEKLDVGSFQHLIVLSDDSCDPQHADARTLVTLLHLRDMEDKLGEPYSIVTEMNDDANREVAEVTKADDFVVSAKLISLLPDPARREPAPGRGVRRPVRAPRARRSTSSRPPATCSPARRPTSPP